MKKNLKEIDPITITRLQELGISFTVLSKMMYSDIPEKKAASRLKGKLYGTGNMTAKDIQLLKNTLLILSKEIEVCAKEIEVRIRKNTIASLNLTLEEMEELERNRKLEE